MHSKQFCWSPAKNSLTDSQVLSIRPFSRVQEGPTKGTAKELPKRHGLPTRVTTFRAGTGHEGLQAVQNEKVLQRVWDLRRSFHVSVL
ncbi:hypothetical protein CERZMDRAFT_90684 [Cercospora zeae-maydis SCOH1-5]|uniref:Uncharacterized protein n=1 Tax=Cercospora zeae-maydis SCOH1-5 TaxID=717836 RepID=A0A6A6FI27_9PEZI|nr:hypothetical protein CERZMDRAFT_90684 [Cercospora zeae-maydis SCOH1-5]